MRWLVRGLGLLLCGCSLLAATELPDPGTEWSRLCTANFTLYSSAGISQTKEIGLELETLRQSSCR